VLPTGPDTIPPYTSNHNPAKNATNVAKDTNIIVHIKDDGDGVDQSSIAMKVEGVVISPTITGTPADYTLTYNPPADFSYNQAVNVTIDAQDLASTPNVMTTDSYSFTMKDFDLLGDITGDGLINIQDIQACVNVILGIEGDPDIVARADVNGDGPVNVLDIQEIVNIILGV
jgi:hypothetical protein